jgi:predicted deacylase
MRIRLRQLLALTTFLVPAIVPAQMSDSHASVSVGTATARRGERAYGVLQVPAGTDSGTAIQIAVVNGVKPGPVVAFVSGAHGTEYTSLVAMTRFIARVDPKKLSGTVIVVPLLNIASFEQMVPHINPVDKKGMNTSYPGDRAGTQTSRVLALVAEQVVQPADVIVDLHGGDLDEDLRPYAYWIRSGDTALDSASFDLATHFGLDMLIVKNLDMTQAVNTHNLSGFALSLHKTTIVAEAGRSGQVTTHDTNALINGSLNVLARLKMIAARASPAAKSITYVGNDSRVRADGGGMFFASATRGSAVKKGAKVGTITDYVGRPLGNILAPQDGIVTFIRGVPSMTKGATLVTVAQNFGATAPAYVKPAP